MIHYVRPVNVFGGTVQPEKIGQDPSSHFNRDEAILPYFINHHHISPEIPAHSLFPNLPNKTHHLAGRVLSPRVNEDK